MLLLYLFQKIESELDQRKGPVGQQGLKLIESSAFVKNEFEARVQGLTGGKPGEDSSEDNLGITMPSENDILTHLLGQEKLKAILGANKLSGSAAEGSKAAPVSKPRTAFASAPEAVEPPSASGNGVHKAATDFERQGREFFRRKFQQQLQQPELSHSSSKNLN